LGLHRLGVVRVELLHLNEPYAVLGVRLENAVDDDDVEMGMLIQRGAESMDEGHCADSRFEVRAGAAGAQASLDGIEQDAQSAVERLAVVLEMIAQTLGHGEHPLAHRQTGQDMIHEVGGGLHHAASVT